MQIEGMNALVAGGASGLGAATARALHAAGANVTIADLNPDRGAGARRRARRAASSPPTSPTPSRSRPPSRTPPASDGLRISVCCAGIGPAAEDRGQQGPAQLRAVRERDPRQPDRHLQRAAPRGGGDARQRRPTTRASAACCINTASIAAYDGQIGQVAYSASKGGIVGLTLPGRARPLAERHPRLHDRPGPVRHAADGRPARGGPRRARRVGPVPAAAGPPGRVRRANRLTPTPAAIPASAPAQPSAAGRPLAPLISGTTTARGTGGGSGRGGRWKGSLQCAVGLAGDGGSDAAPTRARQRPRPTVSPGRGGVFAASTGAPSGSTRPRRRRSGRRRGTERPTDREPNGGRRARYRSLPRPRARTSIRPASRPRRHRSATAASPPTSLALLGGAYRGAARQAARGERLGPTVGRAVDDQVVTTADAEGDGEVGDGRRRGGVDHNGATAGVELEQSEPWHGGGDRSTAIDPAWDVTAGSRAASAGHGAASIS